MGVDGNRHCSSDIEFPPPQPPPRVFMSIMKVPSEGAIWRCHNAEGGHALIPARVLLSMTLPTGGIKPQMPRNAAGISSQSPPIQLMRSKGAQPPFSADLHKRPASETEGRPYDIESNDW
jgi:hypothetical protein